MSEHLNHLARRTPFGGTPAGTVSVGASVPLSTRCSTLKRRVRDLCGWHSAAPTSTCTPKPRGSRRISGIRPTAVDTPPCIQSARLCDPACGSGNFLTETYITLRRLENKILSELSSQTMFAFEDIDASPLKISLDQFYGVEINDFAVSVASTALWIAKLQVNTEAQTIVASNIEDLPLTDSARILQGNALQTDWTEVLEPNQCSYIIGNPPFLGYSRLNDEQKRDRLAIFGKSGGLLDYVACWHKKSAEYMRGTAIRAAPVSTNSICQGQQVSPLWKPLFEDGVRINFAHRTFTWSNESTDQAHVFCIIVGFSYVEAQDKTVWDYRRSPKEERALGSAREVGTKRSASNINGYLADASNVFLERRPKPISDVPEMSQGFKLADDGKLLLTPDE